MVTRYMFIYTAHQLYPFPTQAIDAVLYRYFQQHPDTENYDLADLSRLGAEISAAAQNGDRAPGPIIDPEIWFPVTDPFETPVDGRKFLALAQRYYPRAFSEAYIQGAGKNLYTADDLHTIGILYDAAQK